MMVNVDELNKNIERFGAATNKLNEISDICDDFEKTAKKVSETCSKQDDLVVNQEKANTELRTWLDITLKTTESNLKDKLSLQENKVSELETKLAETEKSLSESIRTLKTIVILTLICSVLAVGATVLMHYI